MFSSGPPSETVSSSVETFIRASGIAVAVR